MHTMVVEKYTIPLERNIAPLYNFATAAGVILPFKYPPGFCGIFFYMRYVVIFLVGFGLCSEIVFGVYSMAKDMSSSSNMQTFVITFTKFLYYPLPITVLTTFTWNRASVRNFLQKWTLLEKPLDIPNMREDTSSNRYRLLCMLANTIVIIVLATLIISVFGNVGQSPKIGNHSAPQISFTIYITIILRLTVFFYALLLQNFGEHMATFAYRHLAFVLVKIEKAFLEEISLLAQEKYDPFSVIPLSSQTSKCVNTITYPKCERKQRSTTKSVSYRDAITTLMQRTEYQDQLVKEAQKLFDPVLFVSYTVSFFTTCSTSYFLFLSLQLQNFADLSLANYAIFTTSFSQFILIIKLIFLTTMCNSLPKQLEELQNTVSTVLLQHWDKLTTEDRSLYRNCLRHLSLKKWAATPLGLFTITTHTLLSMIGLIATYVIVLLQAQCSESTNVGSLHVNKTQVI